MALAERARVRGNRPGALLAYLLREGRFDFISQADEDAAQQRLREWREGPAIRESDQEQRRPAGQGGAVQEVSDQDRTVMAIIRVSNERRLDPAIVARQAKGWSRQEWEEAHWAFQQARFEQHSVLNPDSI